MRQRKVKNLDERIQRCGAWLIGKLTGADPGTYFPGRQDRDTYLEIGCGRGDFIIAQALAHPENNYIAVEGQGTVILRALEKAAGAGGALSNLRFVRAFIGDLSALFPDHSLAGVYLNFSDPWPKARHAKRRLTWRGRLREYEQAVKDGGFLEFKTDNDALFEFTLEEIAACGMRAEPVSRDLHGSDLDARLIMTEYEKKFRESGKNINYLKVIFENTESGGK